MGFYKNNWIIVRLPDFWFRSAPCSFEILYAFFKKLRLFGKQRICRFPAPFFRRKGAKRIPVVAGQSLFLNAECYVEGDSVHLLKSQFSFLLRIPGRPGIHARPLF